MKNPRKLILKNHQSPGDIVMLTAAVRDLHAMHPGKFVTDVRTAAPALWENNPHITPLDESDPDVELIKCEYPLIHQANQGAYHFVHGFRKFLETKLGVRIKQGPMRGDIHLSEEEMGWTSQVEELGVGDDFWIIVAGGKYDFTAKWWDPARYQRVVDRLKGRVRFVQCGDAKHWHPPLEGVVNLVGKTDIRQFIRLVYHSVGVVCPVTFAMHLAAAVPVKPARPKNRACVVIAGGREPAQWEAYPHHQFLHTCGALPCCDNGGCWKSRCQLVGAGGRKDQKNVCLQPVDVSGDLRIPKCMHMIRPGGVVRAVNRYYQGGALDRKIRLRTRREICFLGMKRSGNHAALDWIVSQSAGKVCFLNNIGRGGLARVRETGLLPSLRQRHNVRALQGEQLDLVVYSYEDFPQADALFLDDVQADQRLRVVMLRDPFNLLASTVRMAGRSGQWAMTHRPKETGTPEPDALKRWAERWKQHALEFIRIRDAGKPDEIAISYNRWLADKAYREALREKLGLEDPSDASMENVSGHGRGSSFDGRRLNGRASRGKYLQRWKHLAGEPWFRAVFDDDELVGLSREIFGDIPGTEELIGAVSTASSGE